jgi:hypothetical protein
VARIAAELVARWREFTVAINALERELRDLVRVLAPTLLAVPGCRVLRAATIVGETAGAPVSLPRGIHPVHRHRADPCLVQSHGAQGPPQPGRQLAHQLRPAHDRRHPGVRHRPRQGPHHPGSVPRQTRTEALRLLRRQLPTPSSPLCSPTRSAPPSPAPSSRRMRLDIGVVSVAVRRPESVKIGWGARRSRRCLVPEPV